MSGKYHLDLLQQLTNIIDSIVHMEEATKRKNGSVMANAKLSIRATEMRTLIFGSIKNRCQLYQRNLH